MKVKTLYLGYINTVNIGQLAYFVEVSDFGMFVENKELADKLKSFPRIVFYSNDEIFNQKEDLTKVMQRLVQNNIDVIVEINCKGTTLPSGSLFGSGNIIYNVSLQLKSSSITKEYRLKAEVIEKFIRINANFVFEVLTEDDVDEINMIIKDYGIPKAKVLLTPAAYNTQELLIIMPQVMKWAKNNGFSYTTKFDLLFDGVSEDAN